jgi:hypothetical protein
MTTPDVTPACPIAIAVEDAPALKPRELAYVLATLAVALLLLFTTTV